MSEEFLLKWNDHHKHFFLGAEELCEADEYTDVTLAAGTKFFSAHKLVLSICSPYFRQLFKHLGKDKPVIFLKDVDPEHLVLLLQYMYKGEIKVQETELVNVLSTAQSLDIRGLSDKSGQSSKVPASKSLKRPPPLSVIPGYEENCQKKQKTNEASNNQSVCKRSSVENSSEGIVGTQPDKPEVVPVKQEMTQVTLVDLEEEEAGVSYAGDTQEGVFSDSSLVAGYDRDRGYGEQDFYDESIVEPDARVNWELAPTPSATGTLFCSFCGKEYPHISALKQHMPVHTGEKKFKCTGCDRRFTQSSSLYKHMKRTNCAMQHLEQNRWDSNTT